VRNVNDEDESLKTLKGFNRVMIASGKTCQTVINLPYSSFEFYDRASGKMVVTAVEHEVLYGDSSDAKDLKAGKIIIQ